MRLIDGDALIDKYGDWYTEEGTEEGYIGTIKGIVDSMPTIEPELKWISVSDKFPEDRQKCLVAAKSIGDEIGVTLATYFIDSHKNDKTGWYGYNSRWGYWRIKDVISWIPIPEQYRGKGDS